MTGPVERVPLTDERLDELEKMTRRLERWRDLLAAAAGGLIAELRAARVREQELQQRIDKALTWCHKANPWPDLNGDLFRGLVAALTGTENADAGR